MYRLNIIEHLAKINNASSYLEIGVEKGMVFSKISIANKVGVDPNPKSKATVIMTSDLFFENNNQNFDIIFIDGLHHADQVEKDIINALQILNNGGYIICHDMLPTNKLMETIPRKQEEWTGDCWKAWVKIRSTRKDLSMFVVDTDYGCGIIAYGKQKTIKPVCELTFDNFQKHKQEWMNIISVDKFKEIFVSKDKFNECFL